jgi:hypothetical protein
VTATLQGLRDALAAAVQDGTLTLTADATQPAAIDAFLSALPTRSLTLLGAQVELSDQPVTLVVSGTLADRWPLPGLATVVLAPQAATITYRGDDGDAVVTASATLTATLSGSGITLSLEGSLASDGSLLFSWPQGQQGQQGLSLATAATLAAEGRADASVPVAVSLLDSLSLSSFTLSFSFWGLAPTTLRFGLAADPDATWEIVPGQQVLRQVSVSFFSASRLTPGGWRPSYGGSVGATLALGQDYEVALSLGPGPVWEVDVVPTAGLPALEDLAALVGAGDEVRAGLQSVGLGDITLQAVRLGIDRATSALDFISMQGTLSLAGKVIDVCVRLPDFQFGGSLSDATPLSLTELLQYALGDAGGLPDVLVTELSLYAAPQAGCYRLVAEVEDNQVSAGKYGLTGLTLEIEKQGSGVAAAISAMAQVAGSPVMVTGSYGPGWQLAGELGPMSLSDLLADVLADVGLPSSMASLQLAGLTGTWNLSTGSFAFQGEVDLDIPLGPTTLTSTVALSVSSTVAAPSATRTTSGELTGTLSLGPMVFDLRYDFTPGQQVLKGAWNAQGQASFAALAAAFGLAAPATGVRLPDLSLTSMSFELDWSATGQQAFQLTGATSMGDAFFLVDRPQPGQPWGFVFGAAIAGGTSLSQVLSPVGISSEALDFIVLGGAFFLVSSAAFPALPVPGFAALAGQPLQVSPGVSAGVLADLGNTSGRPDVAALKSLLPGQPPVLLGEVTLSTSLAAIALTLRLNGSLKISGAGSSSLTLTDVALVLKPDPVALGLRGSIEFPVGSVSLLATGLLTVGESGLTAAFDIQGQGGQVLPFPLGFKGVHLTSLGVEMAVTLEPPAVAAGLLGQFVIGPQAPAHGGPPVPPRPLTAMPPPDEFVMIMGLDGELPNPLLLSMYLRELSIGQVIEALTDQPPQGLPAVLSQIIASDVMIYWCDAPAGIQQPDGTWAYAGTGFNAALNLYGFRAVAGFKIDAARGITGDACIDPVHIPGVIDLTGDGPGTPAGYTGQVTVAPGGPQIHISSLASPYLDISWVLTLFRTASQTLNAQLTRSGFTFEVNAASHGFSTNLSCSLGGRAHLEMAFSILLNTNVDLGEVNGAQLGQLRLANAELAATLVADASAAFSLTVNGDIKFNGASYGMPQLSLNVPFSSLAEIPDAITHYVQREGNATFQGAWATAGAYAELVARGLLAGGDQVGQVLRRAYGQSAEAAATAMKAAGYAATDTARALGSAYQQTMSSAAQALKTAGYPVADVGTELRQAYHASLQDATAALQAAGYPVYDVATTLHDTYGATASQAAQALKTAGYGAADIGTALKSGYGSSAGDVATALAAAGYGASDVASVLRHGYGIPDQDAATALRAAGYAPGDIGSALKSGYGTVDQDAAVALRAAGYGAGDVSGALRSAYGSSASSAAQLLKTAGYGLSDVGSALKSTYGASAQDVAAALRSAGYALSDVGNVIKDAFGLGPDQLHAALTAAGFAASDITGYFKSIGGAFSDLGKKLDPRNW